MSRISKGQWWRIARASPVVRNVLATGLGAATVVMFAGVPALSEGVIASWASALGTTAAAAFALYFGLHSIRAVERIAERKEAGAAMVFHSDITDMLAMLEVLHGARAAIEQGILEPAPERQKLETMPLLLTPGRAAFLADLPTETARWIMLAANAQRIYLRYLSVSPDPDYIKVLNADHRLTRPVRMAGASVNKIVFGDAPPPWASWDVAPPARLDAPTPPLFAKNAQPLPTWAAPDDASAQVAIGRKGTEKLHQGPPRKTPNF